MKKHTDKRHHNQTTHERDIAQVLVMYDEFHFRGEALPADLQVYMVKVVTAYLRAGVPLSQMSVSEKFWRNMPTN